MTSLSETTNTFEDIVEIQAGLSRLFQRRPFQHEVAAFFGYTNGGTISSWYTQKNAKIEARNAAKVACVLGMVRGETPWPEGVAFGRKATGTNAEVMRVHHDACWAKLSAAKEAEAAAKRANKMTMKGEAHPLRTLVERQGETLDRIARLAEHVVNLQESINYLTAEWRGQKPT